MSSLLNAKYKLWLIIMAIGIVLVLFKGFLDNSNKDRTPIKVNAPENMHGILKQTLKDAKNNKEYILEFTDSDDANFIIVEGSEAKEKIIAFSPFIAVLNFDEESYLEFTEKGYFITSKIDSSREDFDFNKVIDEILNGNEINLKIYYPSRDSVYWHEFYNFLLITVNDGFYPKGNNIEVVTKRVEDFLNSRNTESITDNGLKKINSVSTESIYFMPYVDYVHSKLSSVGWMYPKATVHHNYYVEYDEIGNILFNSMTTKNLWVSDYPGYYHLNNEHYSNTYFDEGMKYNVVEIPKNVTINNTFNEED